MQRKHRSHRHHKDSKHKHVSKVKHHHKSGHKHHKVLEDRHVSFIDPTQDLKVDRNACGDFQHENPGDHKHSIKHRDKSKSTKDEKQKNLEKYLKELTKLQLESITKHHSLDRQEGSFKEHRHISKREKSSPVNDGEHKKQPKIRNVSKDKAGETKHKHRHKSHKNREAKHKDEARKHKHRDKENKDTKEHKHIKHSSKNSPDRKYENAVQEVLFYQIKPQTPYNPQKEIKDLYHHKDRAKSHETKTPKDEKLREHRHRSKEKREECLRHNSKEDKVKSIEPRHRSKEEREDCLKHNPKDRVKSIDKEKCCHSLRDEKLTHKIRNKSTEKENSKREGKCSLKEAKERHRDDNLKKELAPDTKKKRKHLESIHDTVDKVSFQEKIEYDLKNYFSQIQTMIDKKFELFLKTSKPKVNETFKINEKSPDKVLTIKKIRRSKSADRDSKIIEVIDNKGKVIKLKLRKRSKLKGSCGQDSSQEIASSHHKLQKIFHTADEEKLYIDKKRKRREESKETTITMEQLNSAKRKVVPELQNNNFPPFGSETEGLSKMTSDQSKFTNCSFRHPEPPYEWIFPPDLWSLKIQDFILASQQNRQLHMPPPCSNFSIPNPYVSTQEQEKPSKITNTDFVVQGIEPPSLDNSNLNKLKKDNGKKLECKTVSIIGIQPEKSTTIKQTNDSETQKTVSDNLVERRKKSKRFKVYYKYSSDKNLQNLTDGSFTSDNISVISDSFKPFNEPNEEKFVPKKQLQQELVQNIFIKPREKPTKSRKLATPRESVLNNITEEPTNSSLASVTQCYFKNLSASNSESCLKVHKKAGNSNISIKSNRSTKKNCKYCTRLNFRSKSDIKLSCRMTSQILKSKSDIVLDTSNTRQVVKSILLSGGLPFENSKFSKRTMTKNIVEKKISKPKHQECQTSECKVTDEEQKIDQEVYEKKKKHIKDIFKTIEYLEEGIQTVGHKFTSKKVCLDKGVGNYNIFEKTDGRDKKVLKKDVAIEHFEENKPELKTVMVKDMSVGEVDNYAPATPNLISKRTVCIRPPKSPIRNQNRPITPRQDISHRVARKADISPPKPVPRKSLLKTTNRAAVSQTQNIVLRENFADPTQEPASRYVESKNTPRCSTRGSYKSPSTRQPSNDEELLKDRRCSTRESYKSPSTRQPSNVVALLRDVIEENRNKEAKEKMEVEDDLSKGDTRKIAVEERKPILNSFSFRQNRPSTPASSLKTKPISRQTPNLEKNANNRCYARTATKHKAQVANPEDCVSVISTKDKIMKIDDNSMIKTDPVTVTNHAKEAKPEDCLHAFSPKEEEDIIDTKCLIETVPVSVHRLKLNPLNPGSIKRDSGSISSSVSDTEIHKSVRIKEPLSRSKHSLTAYQQQIYLHTPTSLINERTKTLKKFITEPSTRWQRPKSYVQSLDRYDEKHKSTFLLTKQDKIRGQSSYQKRKIYDAYRREQMKNHFKVYYSINNVITDNLSYGEYRGNFIRQNSFKKSRGNTTLLPTIESSQKECDKPNPGNQGDGGDGFEIKEAKIPSLVTLFMKKDDDNISKLYSFCQKLIDVNASMEFPFNFKETCTCNEVLRDCEACKKFLKNLGAFFTEAAIFDKNDEPEFKNHFSNAEVNLDNEICEFYNNDDFHAESLVDNSSFEFDEHDAASARLNDRQKEALALICEELFPGNLNGVNMEKYTVKLVEGSSLDSTNLVLPFSCPAFQNDKTDFDYLYDANKSSSSKESDVFVNLATPPAFNLNLNQYNVETFANNVRSDETSASSGYESESKPKSKTASHLSFFKKPNIAALFKPWLQGKKSEIKNEEEVRDVEILENNSNARKVREWNHSSDNFEEFQEIPLRVLLSQNNSSLLEFQELESKLEVEEERNIHENNSNAQGNGVYGMEDNCSNYLECKVSKSSIKEEFKDSKKLTDSFVENLKEFPTQNKEVNMETQLTDLCDNMTESDNQDLNKKSSFQGLESDLSKTDYYDQNEPKDILCEESNRIEIDSLEGIEEEIKLKEIVSENGETSSFINKKDVLIEDENKLVEIENNIGLLSVDKENDMFQINPFLVISETHFDEDFCSKSGCKVDFVNEIIKVKVSTYFMPEIFQELKDFENINQENEPYNKHFFENCEEKISIDDLPKVTANCISSDQLIAKKFFDSILYGYNAESVICATIYHDQNFWKNEVFPLLEKKKSKEKKNKKKGFTSFFKRKRCQSSLMEEIYISKRKPSQIHLTRLQDLASTARRCFSMLVDAVKINKNIDENEIKFCAILKMLTRIEIGDFEISQMESNNISFENLIKQQIIDSFLNTFEICQREAKKHKRRLGDTEINLIKCFVSTFRAGLLSRTEIVPVYVGRGLIRTESQLKAAVTFIMRSNSEEINQKEFEEFCEITQNVNKS